MLTRRINCFRLSRPLSMRKTNQFGQSCFPWKCTSSTKFQDPWEKHILSLSFLQISDLHVMSLGQVFVNIHFQGSKLENMNFRSEVRTFSNISKSKTKAQNFDANVKKLKKVNTFRDIHFFSGGRMDGRTNGMTRILYPYAIRIEICASWQRAVIRKCFWETWNKRDTKGILSLLFFNDLCW